MQVRKTALNNFGKDNLADGYPMASLEEVLVPLYLSHRYQVEGVAKLIGGVDYTYSVKGESEDPVELVSIDQQRAALTALLTTIDPANLSLGENILQLIPPKPIGYSKGRESFPSHTGLTFDPLSAAESAVQHTLQYLLHKERAARLIDQQARYDRYFGLGFVLDELIKASWQKSFSTGLENEISRMTETKILDHIFALASASGASPQTRSICFSKLIELDKWLSQQQGLAPSEQAHYAFARERIARFRAHPEKYKMPSRVKMPAGSPIGCGTH